MNCLKESGALLGTYSKIKNERKGRKGSREKKTSKEIG